MKWLQLLRKRGLIKDEKILEFYPPFLIIGLKAREISADYRRLHATFPLRWMSRNLHGTLFGGYICAVADPLPALMLWKIFPETEVWSAKVSVELKRPARGMTHVHIVLPDETIESVRKDLAEKGKSRPTFHFNFTDETGEILAIVENTVFIRKVNGMPLA